MGYPRFSLPPANCSGKPAKSVAQGKGGVQGQLSTSQPWGPHGDIYMYLFHVCFTGLHFVSWKPFWLQDLHLRFILGVYLEKNKQRNTNNNIQQAFKFSDTGRTSFLLVTYPSRLHVQLLFCIILVTSPGWRRAMLVRNPRRGLIGPSERLYQVFAAPQHRHLFTGILSFLTDSSGAFTEDIVRFSLSSAFLRFWTSIFRRVDTPSVAEALTPAASPAASSDSFPEDWTDAL